MSIVKTWSNIRTSQTQDQINSEFQGLTLSTPSLVPRLDPIDSKSSLFIYYINDTIFLGMSRLQQGLCQSTVAHGHLPSCCESVVFCKNIPLKLNYIYWLIKEFNIFQLSTLSLKQEYFLTSTFMEPISEWVAESE